MGKLSMNSPRVGNLITSFNVHVKKKTEVFSAEDLRSFVNQESLSILGLTANCQNANSNF